MSTALNASDITLLSFAALSMGCDVCMGLIYFLNAKVRRLHIWKIVVCISISDFCCMSGYWIAVVPSFEPLPTSLLCTAQASLLQFSTLATTLFHNAIAFELIVAVSYPTRCFSPAAFNRKFRIYAIAIVLACTVSTVVLNTKGLIGSHVGTSMHDPPTFCWIEARNHSASVWLLQYIPVIATFVFCTAGFFYAAVLLHRRGLHLSVHAQFYLAYMFCFLVLWLPTLLEHAMENFNPLYAACMAGHGFLRAVAWVSSLRVHGVQSNKQVVVGCCCLADGDGSQPTADRERGGGDATTNVEHAEQTQNDQQRQAHCSYADATFGKPGVGADSPSTGSNQLRAPSIYHQSSNYFAFSNRSFTSQEAVPEPCCLDRSARASADSNAASAHVSAPASVFLVSSEAESNVGSIVLLKKRRTWHGPERSFSAVAGQQLKQNPLKDNLLDAARSAYALSYRFVGSGSDCDSQTSRATSSTRRASASSEAGESDWSFDSNSGDLSRAYSNSDLWVTIQVSDLVLPASHVPLPTAHQAQDTGHGENVEADTEGVTLLATETHGSCCVAHL
jgi:hypothetical protein